MPEFTTVSVQEAKLQTVSGRQSRYLHEYNDYITKLPKGQAGRLRGGEQESPLTVRRRLAVAAQTLGINLVIKRSGRDVYFWREDGGEEQPRTKRRYTTRNRRGRAGDSFPPQPSIEPEGGEQGIAPEEPLELGQLAQEAERRVEQA
jgi:hypothetical protein